MPVAVIAGVLAVTAGVAAFLLFSPRPDSADGPRPPRRGLACPHLQLALEAYERGDFAAFEEAIARAAVVAEETLQKSGQVFGKPERIALELDLAPEENSARFERLLELAVRDCHDMELV